MNYNDAVQSVKNYLASPDAVGLTKQQVEALSRKLTYTVRGNGPIPVASVAVHCEQLFPELFPDESEEDYMKPPQSAVNEQLQSRSEALQILAYFFEKGYWNRVAPGYLVPVNDNAEIVSRINHTMFSALLNQQTVLGKGSKPVSHAYLCDLVAGLAANGMLEKVPAAPRVVEKVVEAPKPSERDLHNKQVALERAMNDPNAEAIRGYEKTQRPAPKPVLTEAAKERLNAHNTEQNEILSQAQDRIQSYMGRSHASTQSGRAQLKEMFMSLVYAGKDARDILSAVEAKCSELEGNSSVR